MSRVRLVTSPYAPSYVPRLRELLQRPHVRRVLVAVIAGRLPEGMVPLGVVLLVRADGGSYALAGLLSALLAIGSAVGMPPLGRVMDHTGQTRVLVGAAVVRGAALVGIAVSGAGAPVAAAICSLLCGLSLPPLESALRSLWPDLTRDAEQAEAAYRLEAGLQEAVFVLGPVVLAGLVAVVSVALALVATAAIGVLGVALYLSVPPARGWRAARREDPAWTAALRAPGIPPVVFVVVVVGGVIGCVNVAATAFAERADVQAGWLLAAYAFGGLVGGTLAAAREPRRPVEQTLPWLLLALGLVFVPALLGPPLGLELALLALGGGVMAPALAGAFIVVGRRALTGAVAETFAWLTSGVLVGIALGSALAGPLSGGPGGDVGFVVAVGAGVLGALAWWAAGGGTRSRSVPAGAPGA